MKRILKRVTEEWIDPGDEDHGVLHAADDEEDTEQDEDESDDQDESDRPPKRSRRRR